MKKHAAILAAAVLALSAVSAFAATDALVGACIYKFDDSFMTGVRNAMRAEMERQGGELEIVDSQNRQPTQNDQVDAYISKGANALIVNPVDRTAAEPLMQKAKAENLPIVFINREPYAEVMNAYDKIWYVGAKAEESGTQSGQIIADYFKANPKADRNGDGKIQYIMIRGEQGHQDAVLRTEYSIKAMKDAGFEIVELGSDTANWDKVQATDKMKGFISAVGIDNIEAVLANNDDMALGAIEALKAEGYNMGDPEKYIPVVGVDATAPALEAMSKGEMLGTVLNDADNQGIASVKIAVVAADDKPVTDESIGYTITDGKYIWIPYRPVTAENYKEFMK
ncbi:MAG: galactose ABC transporter substrate-binding protein [Synergistaceae bacterium]|nr:galactose ABC transporter substrate-binding protein [Synergistaceae bacterium]